MPFSMSNRVSWAPATGQPSDHDDVSTCESDMLVEHSSDVKDDLPETNQFLQLEKQHVCLDYLARE